ncbi:hypothetical protein M2451_001821 [Dysgonomonas sp. PFB1-18]|nr:hypothetical protein [Dysgonomonas sp. PF1-14]MDH6338870.1 hypothetical protein [Dysgonomonas sp. PF1-16]MDH6380499.1 hypothetical protein [Dysgonomonas sp. PFB1-18]MDH6397698.1 hypothetical protein [Dysgonomonas sp. PF1-23]
MIIVTPFKVWDKTLFKKTLVKIILAKATCTHTFYLLHLKVEVTKNINNANQELKLYVQFLSARNHRLLTFLLPKAAKGIKKSLAPRFIGRPVKGFKG